MSKNQALTLRSSSAPLIEFDQSKLTLIKQTYGKGLTDSEFGLYMAVAKSKGLDPVLGQVHAVKRSTGMTIQVGIDGYRLIASRTKQHAGTDPIQFEYIGEKLHKATCTVYRIVGGVRAQFTATAVWNEYCPSGNQDFMWKKAPENMLGKCAEAKALRMAFPGDLGGLYVEEELQQSIKDVTPKEVQQLNERFSDEPTQAVAVEATCTLCSTKLIKSKTKPWFYCPNFQDSSKGKHSQVEESKIGEFAAKQSEPEVKMEPSFSGDENPYN